MGIQMVSQDRLHDHDTCTLDQIEMIANFPRLPSGEISDTLAAQNFIHG